MPNLNEVIKLSLNSTARIINHKNSIVLVKFEKGDSIEYATFKYNTNSIYSGNYFTTKFSDDNKARCDALLNFYIRTNISS
jgi:hypothetical protein